MHKNFIGVVLRLIDLYRDNPRILVVVNNNEEIFEFKKIVNSLNVEHKFFFFPNIYSDTLSLNVISQEILADRIKFLSNITSNGVFFIPLKGLKYKIINPDFFSKQKLEINEGTYFDLNQLETHIKKLGFQNSNICSQQRFYTLKGKILDIAPIELPNGVRIEFENQKVSKISIFDLITQRSFSQLNQIIIFPQYEIDFESVDQKKLEGILNLMTPDIFFKIKDHIIERRYLPGIENFNLILNPTCVISDFFKLAFCTENFDFKLLDTEENSSVLKPIYDRISIKRLDFKTLSSANPKFLQIPKDKKTLAATILAKIKIGSKCIMFIPEKFDETLVTAELKKIFKFDIQLTEDITKALINEHTVNLVKGSFSEFFEWPEKNLIVLSAVSLLSNLKTKKEYISDLSLILDQLSGFREGDFLVHKDYGICKFGGLSLKTLNSTLVELIKLEFADAILYLPVEQIQRIEKYASFNLLNAPKLDSLSKKGVWLEKKKQAKKLATEFASYIVKNFAVRKLPRGFSYPPKNELDEIFAQDFPFTETIDQIKSTEEVFQDLSSPKLMDRIICGDAGYGKTEVALRAAFKVLSFGKQVAVLCPTNLLCEQNYKVFSSRLSKYDFKVERLNRFLSDSQKKEIIQRFNEEKIHCLIATTSLLSPRIFPKNLGLLIVDEEHKFGVRHKEKITNLPSKIDKIYLSATPLPRSLNLVIHDLRSLSLIVTPPSNRKKHYVVVDEFRWETVRTAIKRELDRGGQVYFVISEIRKFKEYMHELKQLVPPEHFGEIHGKMKASEIEARFKKFLDGTTKLLMATKIVEAGLDIPNANTIIVADAEKFGLAELYQLKGRVGRSDVQGFAYFLFSNFSNLTKSAKGRIDALMELGQVGESYRLAVRDMEMRGVGNFLGKEQKGKVNLVGYDTFIDLVKEAILEIRGSPLRILQSFDPEITTIWPAYIPSEYISDPFIRLSIYRKTSSVKTPFELEEIYDYLKDVFGTLPQEVENYLILAHCKLILKILGISKLSYKNDKLTCFFTSIKSLNESVLSRLTEQAWKVNLAEASLNYYRTISSPEALKNLLIELSSLLTGDKHAHITFFSDT